MSEHCKQKSSCFDGLEAVHGIVTDELSHQGRIYSPYTQTSFGYTGEMEDENGLVYLRARYYNRNTGTFMSMDPYEGTPNRPMSLNGYAYAEGNPVNNTDPSGMVVCSDLEASQRGRCFGKVLDLSRDFGISLTEEDALSPRTKDNWTSPRVNNVYSAVQAISRRLGGNTRRAIGDTEIRLLAQGTGSEAAVTTRCNQIGRAHV